MLSYSTYGSAHSASTEKVIRSPFPMKSNKTKDSIITQQKECQDISLTEKNIQLPSSLDSIKSSEKEQLEYWTQLKYSEILFDSEKDNWNENTSIFNSKIIGKKRLIFMIEEEDGEKFGYFFNTIIKEEFDEWQETDNKSFQFNIKSKDNRLSQPMKYEITICQQALKLYSNDHYSLITIGDIHLTKQNTKNLSYCWNHSDIDNYVYNSHGVKNILIEKKEMNDMNYHYCPKQYFNVKRITVIQMI